ncbi:TIGR01621 family pseudouridine synthase [Paraglaciecola chathamensis]|uniref:TIGR01621 family pseudouridine synthase n=1 Tax=Paraglaciecola chathamensis TaxID=368405 RepID=UPI00177EFE7C|nr:TIGR01621 family pseudouridine synthase [Paraglaciecola oceanifecundans]
MSNSAFPPISVVFDHPDFIIIDKPPGVSVQNEASSSGILPMVCTQHAFDKLWLVHRLDKVTSGLLILAKHAQAASQLGKLFEAREIEKYYLALGSAKPKKKQGTVTGAMKKIRDGKWAFNQNGSAVAVSQFFSKSVSAGIRLYLLKPLTGKTHQLRVMLKSLSSPILGDELYKGQAQDRTYLHAYCLRFTYQGQLVQLVCPPTEGALFTNEECQTAQQEYAEPWLKSWPTPKTSPS